MPLYSESFDALSAVVLTTLPIAVRNANEDEKSITADESPVTTHESYGKSGRLPNSTKPPPATHRRRNSLRKASKLSRLRLVVSILQMKQSQPDCSRARRLLDTFIMVPAICLALQQCPTSRALALVALGRNRACTLAKAMEGDRELRRLNALRLIRVLTVGLFQDLRCRNDGEPILVLRSASEELARNQL